MTNIGKVTIELDRTDAVALLNLLDSMNYHTTAAIMTLSRGDNIITDDDIDHTNKAVNHAVYRIISALEN